jgi:hypothetical protein
MIRLSSDHLLFQATNGESYPVSTESIAVEIVGNQNSSLQPEIVQNAAAAVVHYYKHDLQRELITAAEFSGALEKILNGFGFQIHTVDNPAAQAEDLARIARETGSGELLFFPRLRTALRLQLGHTPQCVRFHNLRECVKQLAGARRWSPRCEQLRDQIVDYLRQCISAEPEAAARTLIVD